MKRRLLIACLCAPLLHAADRVALVIGNDAYAHARPLKAAVNDARAVADAFRALGFETLFVPNAGLETMVATLDELEDKAASADAVIVFFAGHGIESRGANYLVPVDAKLEREVQLQTQALNLDTVLGKLANTRVPARMVILDCCRDNPLEGRSWLATRSLGSGGLGELTPQSLPAATLVMYAASPGKPALDRVEPEDRHSPFTAALLAELPRADTHSFEVFGRVEDAVIRRTEGRQEPRLFYNGSTQPFRNFMFALASASALAPAAAATPPAPMAPLPPAPAFAAAPPPSSVLPERGYFNLDEIFGGTAYASYGRYARARILSQVQQRLKAAGFYRGGIDGAMGPGTQNAILLWQEEKRLEPTGRVDDETQAALGVAGLEEEQPPAIPASANVPSFPRPPAAAPPRAANWREMENLLR